MLQNITIYRENDLIYTLGYNQKQQLEYFFSEFDSDLLNSVYICRVSQVNLHNHIAFVKYAKEHSGVINLSKQVRVQSGALLAAQLTWLGDETKQAKLTTDIRLAGKYVVLLSNSKKHHFAKNLTKQEPIKRLCDEYRDYGLIFRSAIDRVESIEQVREELLLLVQQQQLIKLALKENSTPRLIIAGETKYQLLLKNSVLSSTCKITTNDEAVFNKLSSLVDLWQIDQLSLDSSLSIDINSLRSQVESNTSISGVGLKVHQLSGINLIDIDSKDTQLSFFQVNYLAIDKIVELIKLRDLTGIILIDFIKNMTSGEERQIVNKLYELFDSDWRKTITLGFTQAGIFELIRSK